MGREPRGKARRITDEELRADLAAGLKPAAIARKWGVTRQAISLRVKQLGLTTASAAVAPAESKRYVSQTIDAMEELVRCLSRVNLLQDACDEWLRDADDPGRYDIGPRADEVQVTYIVMLDGKRVAKKAPLATLLRRAEQAENILSIERSETRYSDPRELILRTVSETRQIVGTAADLARMLADARLMEQFREAVLAEIAKESPEVAGRIAEAVRRSLVVCEAFRGPESLPSP